MKIWFRIGPDRGNEQDGPQPPARYSPADTTVWSRVTDGTLLVAREGKSEKKQLQRGLEVLKKSDLLGVVLNGCAHPDHKSYYQRYSPTAK